MSWLERCAAFHFRKTHPTRVNNYTRQGILPRATLGSMPKSGCEGSIKKNVSNYWKRFIFRQIYLIRQIILFNLPNQPFQIYLINFIMFYLLNGKDGPNIFPIFMHNDFSSQKTLLHVV